MSFAHAYLLIKNDLTFMYISFFSKRFKVYFVYAWNSFMGIVPYRIEQKNYMCLKTKLESLSINLRFCIRFVLGFVLIMTLIIFFENIVLIDVTFPQLIQ